MLSIVQKFIRDLSNNEPSTELEPRERQLASAALLIEVARADDNYTDDELDALKQTLSKKFSLSESEMGELINEAENDQEKATSLYEFTQHINNHSTNEEKYQLIQGMWIMAYADGVLNKYEEHLIRRVAELIYISHSDFIRAKHSIKNDQH